MIAKLISIQINVTHLLSESRSVPIKGATKNGVNSTSRLADTTAKLTRFWILNPHQ